jgi:hypothetical protein
VFNNPGVKEAIQLLLESANPGLYASTFGKLAKTGLNKTLSAVTPQISKSIENSTKLRQLKYKINDYVNGLEDLKNHIKYPKKAGSMYFDN